MRSAKRDDVAFGETCNTISDFRTVSSDDVQNAVGKTTLLE